MKDGQYHYDASLRKEAQSLLYFSKFDEMPGKEKRLDTNLQRHDLFPGYVNSKPLSLQKMQNISRTLEGCTSTNKRHFISSSMDQIEKWF